MPKKEMAKPEYAVKVYLGPIIPGVAVTGTVYKNGYPPQLEAVVKEVPAINALLVRPEEVARIRQELKIKTSAASICYEKMAEYVKGRE